MKKLQFTIRTGLLCAMLVLFFNCKKESTDLTPSTWNYATFTDARDGKAYKSIQIGTQEWMAENLAYKTDSGFWYPGNNKSLGTMYGLLYTWDAAKQAVPAGWHLPSDAEWKQLEMFLGMSQSEADGIDFRGTNEGSKLMSRTGWGDKLIGIDEVGFNALPAGIRSDSGGFFVDGWYGYWWSATEGDNSKAWIRLLIFSSSKVSRNLSFKEDAFSVRCIKGSNNP